MTNICSYGICSSSSNVLALNIMQGNNKEEDLGLLHILNYNIKHRTIITAPLV